MASQQRSEQSTAKPFPAAEQEVDINGRPITPRRRRWGMRVNIFCAALGTLFAVVFWPGSPLLSMYLRERLGATLTQNGIFAAIAGIGQLVQVLGVFIFDRTRTRKVLWVTLTLIYRFSGFAAVGFAVYAAVTGTVLPHHVWLLLAVVSLGFTLAQLTANAWWSWIADLAPESVRGGFLANRQLAAQGAALVGLLPVILLDIYGKDGAGNYTAAADVLFLLIFSASTVSGVADIVVHGFIPEPARRDRPEAPSVRETLRSFAEPIRDSNFRRFTLAFFLTGFGALLSVPFIWPYLKSEAYIDIEYKFFFVAQALFAIGMLLGSRYWGLMVDRFGAKPVISVTYVAGFTHAYLLFVTQENAALLVSVVSGVGGFLFSGLMVALPQLMLTLAPERKRNTFVATYGMLTGLGMLAGPWVGGYLGDHLEHYFDALPYVWRLPWGTDVSHMQVLIAITLLWRLCVYPLVLSIHRGEQEPTGMVLANVFAPSQFRTMNAMRLFSGKDTKRKLSALRRMGQQSDRLAVRELISQLEDAEPEIRREATLALGRIGGPHAVDALVNLLTAPDSDVQPEAARALGMAGDRRAVAPLMEKLADSNATVREEAVGALGELRLPDAAGPLMQVLKNEPSPTVFGRSALALADLGVMDAIWEVLPKMHQTRNIALRRQLATAVGNLLGRPSDFYPLLNIELRSPGEGIAHLVRRTRRALRALAKSMRKGPSAAEGQQLQIAADHLAVALEEYEYQKYNLAIQQLHQAATEVLRALHGFAGQDEEAVQFALKQEGRLGVGLWFLQVARQYADSREGKDELLRLDALLGFHFIYGFATSLADEEGRSSARG